MIQDGLLAFLQSQGVLSENQTTTAVQKATQQSIPLIAYLVDTLKVNGMIVAKYLAEEMGYPYFDLKAIDQSNISEDIIKLWAF